MATITPNVRHTEAEFESFVRALLGTIEPSGTLRLLVDMRAIEADPTPERVLAVAGRLLGLRSQLARHHALVVRDEQQSAIASEVASWARPHGAEVQVFWSLEEAEAWLDDKEPGH